MEMSPDHAEQWAKREAEHDAALRQEEQERATTLQIGNRKARRRLKAMGLLTV